MASASSADVTNRTVENVERPRYTRRETLLTMLGVLLVLLLASLDQTIVSTAMPRIVADLHGFDRYIWVTTAYMLTSTVTVPIYGKLSDMLGRKSVYIVGLSLFLAGSALSGAAPSMNLLIAFRAFQGLGAGALAPISIAIIGDLFTPRERARWQGATGAVFGLSSIVGPLVGGWLTQYASGQLTFFRSIGGTVAIAVMGCIMNSAYYPAFLKALPPGVKQALPPRVLSLFNNPEILLSPATLAQVRQIFAQRGPQGLVLFNQIITAVKTGLVQGIHNVFILSASVLAVGLITLFFLKEIELKGGRVASSPATEAAVETAPVSA